MLTTTQFELDHSKSQSLPSFISLNKYLQDFLRLGRLEVFHLETKRSRDISPASHSRVCNPAIIITRWKMFGDFKDSCTHKFPVSLHCSKINWNQGEFCCPGVFWNFHNHRWTIDIIKHTSGRASWKLWSTICKQL